MTLYYDGLRDECPFLYKPISDAFGGSGGSTPESAQTGVGRGSETTPSQLPPEWGNNGIIRSTNSLAHTERPILPPISAPEAVDPKVPDNTCISDLTALVWGLHRF